jgi:hypothetical protein
MLFWQRAKTFHIGDAAVSVLPNEVLVIHISAHDDWAPTENAKI